MARLWHWFTNALLQDLAGVGSVVICPWHKYIVALESGHSYYYDLQRQLKDKGARQRVHDVKVSHDRSLL